MTTWADGSTSAKAASTFELDLRAYSDSAVNTFADSQPVVPLRRFSTVDFGNPLVDVAPAINAALISLRDAGGGTLGLPYTGLTNCALCAEPLELQNRTALAGAGARATRLRLANGVNANMLINHVSTNGTTDANAIFCGVRDLMLDGNKANQTPGTLDTANGNTYGRDAIKFLTNPLTASASVDDYFDTHQFVQRVWLYQHKGNGFTGHGRSEHKLFNVVATECEGFGFVPSYDTTMLACVSDNSFYAGFYIKDRSSVSLVGCKSFYSGHNNGVDTSNSHGFYINNSYGIKLTGCEAQDNWAAGFALVNTSGGSIITGCTADSNSRRGVGSLPAIDLYKSSNNVIDVVCLERRQDGTNSYQQNALRIRKGGGVSGSNDIRIAHFAAGSATIADSVTTDSDALGQGNNITVNGTRLPSITDETYAASFTPWAEDGDYQFLTLTGNITINAPSASSRRKGSRITFKLTQDATGSRTVTFNSVFKLSGGTFTATTTPNKTDFITFLFDGTNWLEVGRVLNVG